MSFPCVISPPSELRTVCLTLISVTSSHSLAFCSPEIIQVGFTNGMIEDPVIDPNVFGSLKCITIKKRKLQCPYAVIPLFHSSEDFTSIICSA